MNRFIAINPDRCIGCGTCQSACSAGQRKAGLQDEPRLSVVQTLEISAAVACHHCEGAPCMAVCPVGAIDHKDNSIVVNEQACVGCKLCSVACPFGAMHPSGTSISGVAGMHVNTPIYSMTLDPILRWEPGVYTCAVKCNLCSYTDEGPQCVKACPTAALSYVDPHEIKENVKEKQLAGANSAGVMASTISDIRRKV